MFSLSGSGGYRAVAPPRWRRASRNEGVPANRFVSDEQYVARLDYQWSANRDVRPEDVTATIYSALGIDYTKVRTDDPLGRGFEYVPYAKDGGAGPVEELW